MPGSPARAPRLPPDATERLLAAFQRAASTVPAYRQLLEEHGVEPAAVVDLETFVSRCPILSKANTFDRFPIDQLCEGGVVRDLADVLTSSGHGGRFSFGLATRHQQARSAALFDGAFDDAFGVATRRTLAVNCLPMGVGFSSKLMTVATTSVREDMATALIRTFGPHYDQVLLASDPLFLRRLLDHAQEQGVDWSRYRLGVVLGEEIFGERFRTYVADRLGLDIERPDAGYLMSSFGVGELGMHLCYETRATIALRRAAFRNPALARELVGEPAVLPMILAFNRGRTLMEALDPDPAGYGRLTVSLLDEGLPLPLLRYQTGDVVRLLDPVRVARQLEHHGVTLPGPLPDAMLALLGRDKERLPDGSHVGAYKDALYSDSLVADRLTGAFRLTTTEAGTGVEVQLVRGARADAAFEGRLRAALGLGGRVGQVVAAAYEAFPYGMSLDYERKFVYYVPAGSSPTVVA